MAAEDLASTLAREVVAYTKLRDRPSKLALVVASASADQKFTVTAPIVNGQQLLRVTGPGATDDIADYDHNNFEGVATIIESGLYNPSFVCDLK